MHPVHIHIRLHWHWYFLGLLVFLFGGIVISQNVQRNPDGSLFLGCNKESENDASGVNKSFWCFNLAKKGEVNSLDGKKLDRLSSQQIHGRSYDIVSNSPSESYFMPAKSKAEFLSFLCGSGNFANTKDAFKEGSTQYTCATHPCLDASKYYGTSGNTASGIDCGSRYPINNPFTPDPTKSANTSAYNQPLRTSAANGNDVDPTVAGSSANAMKVLICDRTNNMRANGDRCKTLIFHKNIIDYQ